MTKLKSKKMTKSTFAIIIMAIAMVAMLAFGGTYAYFTASADNKTSGNIHTATVSLTAGDAVTITGTNKSNLLPGESVTIGVTYTDGSDRGTWVFFKLSTDTLDTSNWDISAVKIGGTALSKVAESGDYSDVYYYENSTITGVTGKSDAVASGSLAATVEITLKTSASDGLQNTDYAITIAACSVQHAGLDTAAAAVAQSAFKKTT